MLFVQGPGAVPSVVLSFVFPRQFANCTVAAWIIFEILIIIRMQYI